MHSAFFHHEGSKALPPKRRNFCIVLSHREACFLCHFVTLTVSVLGAISCHPRRANDANAGQLRRSLMRSCRSFP